MGNYQGCSLYDCKSGERGNFLFHLLVPHQRTIKEALTLLNEYSLKTGAVPEYRGITLGVKELMEEVMPNAFSWEEDRDNFDYTYLTENLVALSGRAYHGKRIM